MFSDVRQFVLLRRTMLGVEGSVDPSQVRSEKKERNKHYHTGRPLADAMILMRCLAQDYLGVIDPNAAIVMKPADYLSDDDLAAVNLHVLDCMFVLFIFSSSPRGTIFLLPLCTGKEKGCHAFAAHVQWLVPVNRFDVGPNDISSVNTAC